MMNTPVISIIIPVYNSSQLLTRCIESVINQTYRHFELFLIDDHSVDDCRNICVSFSMKDNRVHSIHNESNLGVSITRNIGITLSKGEYLIFIDNDDFIDPHYLESFVEALSIYPDAELITQNVVFHEYDTSPYINSDQISLGGPWGKLFKRSVIEENHLQFVPGIKYNEDNLFLLDFLECSNYHYNIPDAGYHYFIHAKSSSKSLEKDWEATSRGLKIMLQRLDTPKFKTEFNQLFAENRCGFIFHRYLSALFHAPFHNCIERKNNFSDIMRSSQCVLQFYPKQYRADSVILLFLKLRLFSIAFFANELLFLMRIEK